MLQVETIHLLSSQCIISLHNTQQIIGPKVYLLGLAAEGRDS